MKTNILNKDVLYHMTDGDDFRLDELDIAFIEREIKDGFTYGELTVKDTSGDLSKVFECKWTTVYYDFGCNKCGREAEEEPYEVDGIIYPQTANERPYSGIEWSGREWIETHKCECGNIFSFENSDI